jgi:hypothetical protein
MRSYHLKNVQISQHLSEETLAFTATIYEDGRRIGRADNHGQGAPNCYERLDPAGFARLEDHAKEVKAEVQFERLDCYLFDLLERFRQRRQAQGWLKKDVLFRLKGDKAGAWRIYRKRTAADIEPLRAHIAAKHGDKVECIVTTIKEWEGATS